MKKYLLSGLAVTAIAAVGAAPASAQSIPPRPGCDTSTVPRTVTCAFDTAVWGVTVVQQADDIALDAVSDAANLALQKFNETFITVGNAVDDIEEQYVEQICLIALDLEDPEDCPTL